MEKRKLGNTPEYLSIVGFGGILVMDEPPETASRHVATAIERGINYFDVAPSYGNAEERLGPALKPYRKNIFLACKTGQRDEKGAEEELYTSLKRLHSEHFDLYQLHAVTTDEDVQKILGPNGALETLVKARRQGLVRYLGFSAHSESAALALMEAFAFDTILFPINWTCWYQGNFGSGVLPKAQEKGLGILALKALCKRAWTEGEIKKWNKTWYAPVENYEEAALAMRFTLTMPGKDNKPAVTAAVSPGHIELFKWACNAADSLEALSNNEIEQLKVDSQGLEPIFA